MTLRLFVPVSNEDIAQPLAEAAVVEAMGFPEAADMVREGTANIGVLQLTLPANIPAAGAVVVACERTGAGIFQGGPSEIRTGIFWDVTLTNAAWPDGWAEDYLLARWLLAGATRSLEMAPWTARLDPRAQPRPSLSLRPATGNPYGLPVHLLA